MAKEAQPRSETNRQVVATLSAEGRLTGWRPQQGQLEQIIAQRRKNNNRPLMTYGGRDFTGYRGPKEL